MLPPKKQLAAQGQELKQWIKLFILLKVNDKISGMTLINLDFLYCNTLSSPI